MDRGVLLVILVVAFAGGMTAGLFALRSKWATPDYERLMTWTAAIRSACGNVLDEATIRTLAGYAWDVMDGDMSEYFTREQFIDLVLRALKAEPETATKLTIRMRQVREKRIV